MQNCATVNALFSVTHRSDVQPNTETLGSPNYNPTYRKSAFNRRFMQRYCARNSFPEALL